MTVLPLVLLLGLQAPATASSPSGLELRWDAPRSCPDRAAVLARIDATLGEVTDRERRPVRVHGRLEPAAPEGFVLRLEIDDGSAGTRELRGASCEDLTDAAALVVAMTIDPRLLEILQGQPSEVPEIRAPDEIVPAPPEPTREVVPPGEPATIEPAPAAPEPPPVADAPRRSTEPEPLRFVGRVHAGVGGGPLPGAAAVLGLALGLGGRRWRAELTATYWTPRTGTSPTNSAIGVRAQLWSLGAQACGEPRWRTLSFPLCAGVLAGLVHARGTGELQPRSVASRWVAATLEPGLTWWARPRLGLAVRARGHAALARPELRSNPSGTVFVSAPVGGSLLAGVELRLP